MLMNNKSTLALVLLLSFSIAGFVPAQVPAPADEKARSEKEIEKRKEAAFAGSSGEDRRHQEW